MDVQHVGLWYSRWQILGAWKRQIAKYGERAAYEIMAIFERWCITAFCYHGSEWLEQTDFAKLHAEIRNCKKIQPRNREDIITSITGCVAKMREAVSRDELPVGQYSYGKYQPRLRATFAAEFSKYDPAAVVEMLLRYECMCPQGQQWSVPRKWIDAVKATFGLDLVAFASPINRPEGVPYCSGATEDARFGSLGSFLKLNPESVLAPRKTEDASARTFTIEVNPPFIEQVLSSAVAQVETFFRAGGEVRLTVLFIGPDWTDAEFHTRLREHFPTLPGVSVRSEKLLAGKYSYENATSGAAITTRQNSWLHIITNYSAPEAAVKAIIAAIM